MYYMVYYEHSTGCSSSVIPNRTIFNELDEARDFIKKLQKHNRLSDIERAAKHIGVYDKYYDIKLCIVLEETYT